VSEALKVLIDDHHKVRDLFKQFGGGTDHALALKICQELTMHAMLEEEIVYPVLRRDVDADLAEEAEDEHDEMKQLIMQVQAMESGDPQLPIVMERLQRTLEHHVEEEETEAFPKLEEATSEDLYAMGNELFRRRQELMSTV
jgi:iron-sulfur cluster repair protein YtfE (RIC family)